MDILVDIFNWQRMTGLALGIVVSIAWDLYWGFVWWVFFLDRPIYREEEPGKFWTCEAAMAVAALFLCYLAIEKLLSSLAG